MDEEELLQRLRERFGDAVVQRGKELADAGVRLDKDHRMINPGMGIFKDYGVASIFRTESKVEFEFESLVPRCLSCGLTPGTICHHVVATLIAANRQGFLADEQIKKMSSSLLGVRERSAAEARRVCPICHRPLDISSQIVCPKCGRAVCPDCFKRDQGMCTACYERIVLGKKPGGGGILDALRSGFGLLGRKSR